MAIAIIAAGCRSKPKTGDGYGPGYTGDSLGDPQGIGGDGWTNGDEIPLPSGWNAANLTPVTDAQGIYPVYFAYDAFSIPQDQMANIDTVAEFLRINPVIVLVVEGNCDERGTNEYNISLGERRALAVREQLIALGVDGARVQTVSYGEERPSDAGHDENAWVKNRRADFAFYRR